MFVIPLTDYLILPLAVLAPLGINETLIRLASDPANESLNLNEGLLSIINNFIDTHIVLKEEEIAYIGKGNTKDKQFMFYYDV